ncbi:MAG: mechanosensitive ion channel family protein [Gammaproteobacteria bacterium]|jgi:MscS family membrane protein|nr:mechanosensitive ion channel family protein [Gammaproteobacteria bacterium]
MNAWLEQSFYGNTALEWGIALGIIAGAIVLSKLVYWILGSVVRRMAAKTDTRLDNIAIDMLEEPAVAFIVLAGVNYALNTLSLPAGLEAFLDKVLGLLIALTITWLAARLFDSIYKEYILPLSAKTDTDLDDQLLPILRKTVKAAIWAFGLIIGFNNAGYDVAALLAGIGIGGLALAMAAKDSVSNVFGGFTIIMDQPFSIGDRVQVAGHDGTVEEIGIRSTRLRTLEGREVSIPNSKFTDSTVENVSREPSRKVVSNLGLTYDTTPDQMREAMDILRRVAGDNASLEEKVTVAFNAFGDSAMNILFIYYIKSGADIAGTQSEINLAILDAFNSAGLEFAFPTQMHYTKAV